MSFETVRVANTGYLPGPQDWHDFETFAQGFLEAETLEPLLHPDYRETSLWTDGALEGLPGARGVAEDATPDLRVSEAFLQGVGHQHFVNFREKAVGAVSRPRPGAVLSIAYFPTDKFANLPGMPENVRDLVADSAVTTTVAAVRYPYVQTAAMPDFPPLALAQLGREGFGDIPFEENTPWDVEVVFALHTVGNLAVGRTGLAYGASDVPTAIRDQVRADRREADRVPVPSPYRVARSIMGFPT